MISDVEHQNRHFNFERDTFSFANELFWEYRFDPTTGALSTRPNSPPPTYAHRCFVMVRSARQFFYHARFAPNERVADDATYARLIRQVVRRSPRASSPESERIVIPGYDCLRSFSKAREPLLKAHCGGAWQSYFLRSHWRMVFPISRNHQARMAGRLVKAFETRPDPIVHLVRFPQLTINHGITLFKLTESGGKISFSAYDPNQPSAPTRLEYDRAQRTFFFPQNHYWAGGQLDVIEVYRGWFY
jgi:hypothetical protein